MKNTSKDNAILQRALDRERMARSEAEQLLESKSSELFESNRQLLDAQGALEEKVAERTRALELLVEELNVAAKGRSEALIELRQARDEALRLMEGRTDFFARISHDLRTPLNAIVGLVKLLLQEDLASDQKSKLATIDNSGRVLLSMINEILEFTKIDAGEVNVELVPTDIAGVTNSAIDMLTEEASRKDIPIYLRSRSGLPEQLLLDPMRVEQILINLLSNAVKFTNTGSITVDLDIKDGPNPRLVLRVTDTGSGIPPDRLDKIFLPFKQTGKGGLVTMGGTGLGLAIVDRLVRLLGGEIDVQSTVGKGSSFEILLPAEKPQVVLGSAQENLVDNPRQGKTSVANDLATDVAKLDAYKNMGQSKPLKLLVADDNQVNREVLEFHLTFLGYEADYVSNGEEAIRATIERNYDLILIDISMPVVNGEEACSAIRALKDVVQPTIVAVTASAMPGDKERYLAAGMDDYLAKPLAPLTLANLLQDITPAGGDSKVWVRPEAIPGELIDIDELQRRLGDMVEPMLTKIAPVFLAELSGRLAKLEAAYKKRNESEVISLLHALKGSSASTGCLVLAGQCAEGEALARAGKRLDAQRIDTLVDCARETGVALQQYVAKIAK